eukprot:1419930-Pyramimonas_sp.AAC.1
MAWLWCTALTGRQKQRHHTPATLEIRTLVANASAPSNMTWSRILAPFIWESSTERGRDVLRE